MMKKTKLRLNLEALTKGKGLRLAGIKSSKNPNYRKAVSAAANVRVSTGSQFRVKLGPTGLTITRKK
jgi:hypothetical protein